MRPRSRSECAGGVRPCPWVSCRYHLAAPPSTALEPNREELDQLERDVLAFVEHAPETCAIDVADRGDALSCDQIGELLGPGQLSRERVAQIEARALRVIGPVKAARMLGLELRPEQAQHRFLRRDIRERR